MGLNIYFTYLKWVFISSTRFLFLFLLFVLFVGRMSVSVSVSYTVSFLPGQEGC